MEIFIGFKTKQEHDFPNIVNVCVLRGNCNASCIHCPVGLAPPSERKQKFGDEKMSLETFKKIVDQMFKFKHSTLRLHGVGEPVLWEHLEKALIYAKSKDVMLWIFTNAITKNNHLLDVLVNNCSIVEVSVNSYEEKDYLLTKGVNQFALVNNNIKFMHSLILKNNLKTRLIVSRVENSDELYNKQFIKYWKNTDLVADAFIRSYHNYNGLIKDKTTKEARDVVPCKVHWTRFNIDCDGSAIICFNELFKGPKVDPTIILGTVTNNTIQQIWQGKKLSLIRKAQLERNYDIINFTKNVPCIECKYCQPFDTKRVLSENQIKQIIK